VIIIFQLLIALISSPFDVGRGLSPNFELKERFGALVRLLIVQGLQNLGRLQFVLSCKYKWSHLVTAGHIFLTQDVEVGRHLLFSRPVGELRLVLALVVHGQVLDDELVNSGLLRNLDPVAGLQGLMNKSFDLVTAGHGWILPFRPWSTCKRAWGLRRIGWRRLARRPPRLPRRPTRRRKAWLTKKMFN